MDDAELANQCLLTATALLRGTVDTETWAGDLYLTPGNGDSWDVHVVERSGGTETTIWVDAIAPQRFGSAQILASYLVELSKRDAVTVDLPSEGKHRGELLIEDRSSDANPKG